MNALEIELALSRHFDPRKNFIIPNLSWGFRRRSYETDVVIVTKCMYAYEIEIKISASDLKRDCKKVKWNYYQNYHDFRKSFFAIPEDLVQYQEFIPAHAGILAVSYDPKRYCFRTREVRAATIDDAAKKITEAELAQIGRLAMLRMWDLKRSIYQIQKQKSRDGGATGEDA